VQFKKLCVDNYGTRTVSLALGIYNSDWKSSLSSLDIGKMSKSGFIDLVDNILEGKKAGEDTQAL
jgi:hypothetical protein